MDPIKNLLNQSSEIEHLIEYTFQDKEHLLLAFIHRSFFNEHREIAPGHNERLEFLGDSVLGLIVSGYLYRHLPEESEGHLSHLRAHLVGAESCGLYAEKLQLEKYLLLGKGESANVGRGRERILTDLFEAVVGAIYLDAGLAQVKEFFLHHFSKYLDQAIKEPLRNWKAELQNYAQKKYQKPPDYKVIEESGPAHSKTFVIMVELDHIEVGRGEGLSKKQAEQAAAEDALRSIEKQEEKSGES